MKQAPRMNSRFLVGLTLVVVATTAHACQSKANKTADKIVDGKWIEAKPPPNAELIHWSITVTRDKQGVPNSVVYLVVHTHKHLVTKVTGNEIKPMDRELYVGWHIPSKAVTACSGWFAGGGDFYYVLKTSDRLRIYHRAIDESDKKASATRTHQDAQAELQCTKFAHISQTKSTSSGPNLQSQAAHRVPWIEFYRLHVQSLEYISRNMVLVNDNFVIEFIEPLVAHLEKPLVSNFVTP